MRCSRLIKLAVLGAILPGLFAGVAVADERGAAVARPYEPGTVRVTAHFADGAVQDGFGFVVGERADGALFAVTADHVVAYDHDDYAKTPPQRPSRIEVRFAAAPDEPTEAERLAGPPARTWRS